MTTLKANVFIASFGALVLVLSTFRSGKRSEKWSVARRGLRLRTRPLSMNIGKIFIMLGLVTSFHQTAAAPKGSERPSALPQDKFEAVEVVERAGGCIGVSHRKLTKGPGYAPTSKDAHERQSRCDFVKEKSETLFR